MVAEQNPTQRSENVTDNESSSMLTSRSSERCR